MKNVFILVLLLVARSTSLSELSSRYSLIEQNAAVNLVNGGFLGDPIKYNGKGFDPTLLAVMGEAINDAAIFYNQDFQQQATFINKKMKQSKPGDWNVVIVKDLNITKITDVSTQLFYYSQNDTWALWYEGSSFSPLNLHLVVYNGINNKTASYPTTQKSSNGKGVPSQTKTVIDSIVKTLNTSQDIAKYIQKYDGQKWSVLSLPLSFSGKKPLSYGCLSVSEVYVTYNGGVFFGKDQYSLMIFV